MSEHVPETEEAPPWRSDMGVPEPEVTCYPPGQAPGLAVYVQGRWRYAIVRMRHTWADGRVAYHVSIRLPWPSECSYARAYWSDQPGSSLYIRRGTGGEPRQGNPSTGSDQEYAAGFRDR
ncbi:hypothetical protein [Streptomyces sp. 8N706]|uniref:hypothetical protein n=1 Tax=Streptomyces sp. 8N706 TaxID=3457416 RepID=UPI003FD53912